MSFGYVNGTNNGALVASPGSSLANAAASLTAGNFCIVNLRAAQATAVTITGVSDTAGNTGAAWTIGTKVNFGTNSMIQSAWCANCLGNASNVITVSFSGSAAFAGVWADQFSGVALTSPFDATANASGSNTTSSYTTAQAVELGYAIASAETTSGAWNVGSSGFSAAQATPGGNGAASFSCYQFFSSIQTGVTTTLANNIGGTGGIYLATFEAPSAPAAGGEKPFDDGGLWKLTEDKMATATFVKEDTTTQGNWQGFYGAAGVDLATVAPTVPTDATVSENGSIYIWSTNTADPRGLENSGNRVAATWYGAPTLQFSINTPTNTTRQIAIYCIDWDSLGRAQTVTVTDAVTGVTLDTRSLANFSQGVYLIWSVSGNINITMTSTGYPNAVVSGVFFGVSSTTGGTSGTGGTTGTTTSESFTVVMVTTPAAPSHSVVLAWTAVTGATGYNVYRGTTKLNSTPLASPSYIDLTVSAGQSYQYSTTSIVSGVESAMSTAIPVTIPTP